MLFLDEVANSWSSRGFHGISAQPSFRRPEDRKMIRDLIRARLVCTSQQLLHSITPNLVEDVLDVGWGINTVSFINCVIASLEAASINPMQTWSGWFTHIEYRLSFELQESCWWAVRQRVSQSHAWLSVAVLRGTDFPERVT
jgi:hypothetical protein